MPAQLVGRSEELGEIAGLLSTQAPVTVVLAGEAGIGKTSLWSAGVAAVASDGRRVLSSRPSEADAAFAFAAVSDLLAGAEGVLDSLPPVQRRALDAALLLGDAGGPVDERTVAASFLGAVRTIAHEGPVCLAVDDLQWVDPASLSCLRFALARLGDVPVVSFLAVRGEPPAWLIRAVPEERLAVVVVGGLSVGAIQEIARRRLGVTFPRPTLVRLWETSGGNPLFALELATALHRRGGALAPGETLPVSADLETLLSDRLDGLSPGARDVARVAAALAQPTESLVGTALDRPIDDDLAEAVTAQILELRGDEIRFVHPLLRSAVARWGPSSRRAAVHARLAEVVPTLEERAHHLALAATEPSGETAAVLESAVVSAGARGAPATAAELADHACRLTPPGDGEGLRRRLVIAATWHDVAGDVGRAIGLLQRARDLAPGGAERARVLTRLADVQDDPRATLPLYEEALAEARGHDGLVAGIHIRLASAVAWGEGVDVGLAHAEEAVRAAFRTDDVELRCSALAAQGDSLFRAGQGIQHEQMGEAVSLERALPGWPLDRGPTDLLVRQLVWSLDLEPARRLLSEMLDVHRHRDDPDGEATVTWYLALLEWRAGNWPAARRFADHTYQLRTLLGQVMPTDHFAGALVAAHQGRVDEARAIAQQERAAAETMGIQISVSGSSWVLGFLELSLGDPAAALPHLRRSYEVRNAFMREPGQRIELGDLIEALVATGELDEAQEIVELWQPRAESLDRAWALAILARCRGLVRAAEGDLEGALNDLDRALGEHERDVDPFHRARTLLVRGRVERRAKKRAAARRTLEDARARFERLGAPLWAAQASAEIARIGGRVAGGDELTEAERRIAELVGEGRTNRDVAAALFLTEHSVETALTRIYRKLGVRSRSELTRHLSANT